MKNKLIKMMKTVVLSAVAVSVIAIGSLGSSVGAYAAEADSTEAGTDTAGGVIYVDYSSTDITSYLNNNVAPEYTGNNTAEVGYLFGGWYDKADDGTYTAIKDTADLQSKTGTLVAKFVSAQTLSVKCQNKAGTKANSESTVVRVISAVDSVNYSSYGFVVSMIDKETGDVTDLTTKAKPYTSSQVYSEFKYYDSADDTDPTSFLPSQLFGSAAQYFTTCTIGEFKQASGHYATIVCIKPFWETLDGTRVYGLSKFAHVEDGYMGYVNVPVNLNILNEENGAAAGILTVTSENTGLSFLGEENGIECGNVFDEMEFNVTTDSDGKTIIKCVGNTSDISDMKEMDIYINLRFQRTDNTTAPVGDCYTFSVTEEEFCNSSEKFLEADDVWNIKY